MIHRQRVLCILLARQEKFFLSFKLSFFLFFFFLMSFGGPRDRDGHRGGEPDSYEPDNFGLTEYYTDEKAANIMKKKRGSEISVLYYNIESLPLHFTKLHTKLVMFNIKPDIIVLSETKITLIRNSYYKPHLEGYTFYQSQSSSTHGSVGVFINNSLDIVI